MREIAQKNFTKHYRSGILASNQGAQAPKAPVPVRLTETKEVLHDEKQTMEICGKSGPAAVSECQHCGRRLCGRRLGGGTRLPRRWRWLAAIQLRTRWQCVGFRWPLLLSEQLDDRFRSHLHQQRKTGAVLCLAGVVPVVLEACAVQPCGLQRSGRGGPQQPRQHDYHKQEGSHLHRRGLYRRSLL